MLHRDTDGDNVFEFGDSAGTDEPYVNQHSEPMTGRATIQVGTQLTRSPSTDAWTATSEAEATPTGGNGPGFEGGATLGRVALASALLRWRQSSDDGV